LGQARRAGLIVLGLLTLAYAPTVFIGDQGPVVDWVGEIVPIVVPAIAALLCGMAARRRFGRERVVWVLLATGAAAWAAGDVAYTVLSRTGNSPGPFSIADVGYLALIFTWLTAILLHPSIPRRGLELSAACVEALTVLALSGTAVVAFVLLPVHGAELAQINETVLLAYPFGDLLLIAAFAFLLARSWLHLRSPSGLIGLSVVFLLIADSAFARLEALGSYETGTPTDLFWIAAFLAVAIAAVLDVPLTESVDVRSQSTEQVSIIGTLATAALVLVAVFQRDHEVLVAGTTMAAVLIVVRRLLFVFQNKRLMQSVSDHASMSQEAARAKEAFVVEASHQLRTPLTSIRVRLDEMNVIGLDDPLASEYLDELSVEVDRLRRLAERLLTLASVEVVRPKQPRDVMAVVHEAADRLAQRARLAQVNLEIYPLEERAVVVAAPGALEESLSNLIDNALKYSPKGGTVMIGVTPNEMVYEIWVEDDGPGIDEDLAERLFEPFYRVASQKPGYGLGLAIVKRICDSENVQVGLSLRPQGGTRALMRWPRSALGDATLV
jgi:signal transduction histidine kinase